MEAIIFKGGTISSTIFGGMLCKLDAAFALQHTCQTHATNSFLGLLLTYSLSSLLFCQMQAGDVFLGSSFKVFADTLENGGVVKALCVPGGAKVFSNTDLKKGTVYNEAFKAGAKGLPFLKVMDSGKGQTHPSHIIQNYGLAANYM